MHAKRLIKLFYFDQINQNLVPHYLWAIKVLNRNPFMRPTIKLDDLDQQMPECFNDAYELSDGVMIRSYASQNLSKSNVI